MLGKERGMVGEALSSREAWMSYLASVLVLTAFLAVCAPAGAAPTQFGSPGEGSGQMLHPKGIAVDDQAGEAFVADSGNARADAWTESGVFRLAWGEGVADGAEVFEMCEIACEAGLGGTIAGGFGENPAGVAVDNSLGVAHGDVYIVDRSNHRIEQFAQTGEFLAAFGGEVNETKDGELGASQAEKNVCTAESGDTCKAGVPGHGQGAFEELSGAIAVDSNGTVYVGDRERVQELSPAGTFEGEMTLPSETGAVEALAVDSSKGFYVTYGTPPGGVNGVHKFEFCPGVCIPTESGAPRDGGGDRELDLAVGPANELLVYDVESARVLAFAPEGQQTLSMGEGEVEGVGGGGIVFNSSSNTVYVLHPSGFVRILPAPSAGPIVEDEQAEVETTSATATALVNPEGPEATTYQVDYGLTTAYGAQTEVTSVGAGEPFEAQHVIAEIQGLRPETTYHFRFVVTNAASETTIGPDATLTTLPAVSIGVESVEQITATSARLVASLNPHGIAASYRFEYGTSTEYGNALPVGDGHTGAWTGNEAVSVNGENLSPHTTYHYRLVAENALGADVGPDQEFTTSSVEPRVLLDGRAWEQVSPPDKHGVALEGITAEGGLIEAAADGSAITYIAHAPITDAPAGNRSVAVSQELARHLQSGWTTEDINPPNEEVVGLRVGTPAQYLFFSEDLSAGVVFPEAKTPLSPSASERTIYSREADGEYLPLVFPGNVPEGTRFGGEEPQPGQLLGVMQFVGASKDAKHIVLASPAALVPGLTAGNDANLFEWTEGKLELVSVLPDGHATSEDNAAAALGSGNEIVRGAVSEDGGRIFFTSENHLFVRDRALGETLQVDVQQAGARGGHSNPVFEEATPSGNKVFFTDEAKLTRGSAATQSQSDLYMCEVTVVNGKMSCSLRDLTTAGILGESADVVNAIPGIAENGNYAYFVARGALTADSTPAHCRTEAQTGPEAADSERCNLYVENTTTGEVRLVAQLSGRDVGDWGGRVEGRVLSSVTSRVSDNGEWLAFMSDRPLTGFDNADAHTGAPDQEVFLYQRATGRLTCVTCAATGERPAGILHSGGFPGLLVDRSLTWTDHTLAGVLPGWTRSQLERAYYQSRYLSNEGRLFFDSAVGLVPADSNGTMDVYEFEPDRVGGCSLEFGCVGLVSSGESGEESAFLDASSDGNDVFFLTASQLAKSDKDSALDIYDAHVCSNAAPCPTGQTSLPEACDSSQACREPAPPVTMPGTLATEAASGSGNFLVAPQSTKPAPVKPKAKKCPKGEKLSHGKCKRKPSKSSKNSSKRRSSKKASARVERRAK
jgi:hypothetical protein